MACIGCEEYAKRITNIFRDEDLKNKFEELVSVEIQIDCFICDDCNGKLSSAHEFQQKCFEIYKKNNNVLIYKHTQPIQNMQSAVVENDEFYLVKDVNESELEFVDRLDTDDVVDDDLDESYISSSQDEFLPSPKTRKRKRNLEAISPNNEKKPKNTSTPNTTSINIKNVTIKSSNAKKQAEDNPSQNKRNSYTVGIKLAVIELAEKQGNRVASRIYHMNESCVRGWRKQKDQLLKMNINKKTQRRAFPHWPELEVELKQWVNDQYQNDTKVKIQDIKSRAIEIAQKQNLPNFKGTNSFIFKFMKRNDVPSASPKARKCKVETITSETIDD